MVMDDIVSITLLRHGITKENKERKYIGWMDVCLDEEALKSDCVSKLDGSFDVIYTSDLKRCKETAELVTCSQAIIEDRRLREINFGLWEGKTYQELKDSQHYQNWINEPYHTDLPEGEAFLQFKTRVLQSWREIIAQFCQMQNRKILIVTHGGTMRLLLDEYSPEYVHKSWWDWEIDYFGGYTLSWKRQLLLEGGWRCTSSLVEPFTAKRAGS
jgi:alpha-ribazole phosphatase